MNLSVSRQTDYPKIYKKTYWGAFKIDRNSNITPEIISNRNRFITDYSITKCLGCWDIPKYVEKMTSYNYEGNEYLDHVEIYKMSNSSCYLLVSSPYDYDTDVYTKKGWTQIYPIYSITATTFVKLIDYERYRIENM
jgi:hypothetical protein